LFGFDRFEAVLRDAAALPDPESMQAFVISAVRSFAADSSSADDDMTLLVIRLAG
jgi:serine phosphatase RsbU (regulator of sigma subunit)